MEPFTKSQNEEGAKKIMEVIAWIELIKQAKLQGLTPGEVREFLEKQK